MSYDPQDWERRRAARIAKASLHFFRDPNDSIREFPIMNSLLISCSGQWAVKGKPMQLAHNSWIAHTDDVYGILFRWGVTKTSMRCATEFAQDLIKESIETRITREKLILD